MPPRTRETPALAPEQPGIDAIALARPSPLHSFWQSAAGFWGGVGRVNHGFCLASSSLSSSRASVPPMA
jgi:hypothetical protein